MIDKFSRGFINTVYDFNDFTINELLCKLAQKMDEVITQSNESFNYLEWLKGEGLSDEVIKILSEWKEDGTLETLINDVLLQNIQNDINNIRTETNTFKTETNETINSFKTETNETINTFKSETNTSINNSIQTINDNINTFKTDTNNLLQQNLNTINSTINKMNRFAEVHYLNNTTEEFSALIKTKEGKVILIDCCEGSSATSIKHRLNNLKVTTIDIFIISHFHSDHAGSYSTILNNFDVKKVYYKPITWTLSSKEIGWQTDTIYSNFVSAITSKGIDHTSLTEDIEIQISDNEKLKIMNTAPYPYTNKSSVTDYSVYDYNYESLMVLFKYNATEVLFQCDCPSNVAYERYINTIEYVDHLQITHHGQADNINKEWMDKLRPRTGFATRYDTNANALGFYKGYEFTKIYKFESDKFNSGCLLVTDGGVVITESLNENNRLFDRFITLDGYYVYVNSNGDVVKNGIVSSKGVKYIIKNYKMQYPSDDGWYYPENGELPGSSYALNPDGSIKINQWVKTNGYNYYVDHRGIYIRNGYYRVGTTLVNFDENGHATNLE